MFRTAAPRRVVALAKEAGIAMVPGGQTFPYRHDPNDRNLRIAPSFPSLEEVTAAADGIAICIQLAAARQLGTLPAADREIGLGRVLIGEVRRPLSAIAA